MSHIKLQGALCVALSLATGLLGCSSDGSKSGSTGASANAASGNNSEIASPTYSVEAGTDLAPPAAGEGYQIETPDYKADDVNAKNMIVQPNQEIFLCYYVTLPNSRDRGRRVPVVDVARTAATTSSSTQGGTAAAGITPPLPSRAAPSSVRVRPADTWVYATSTPGAGRDLEHARRASGCPFTAAQQLVLNMHFINTGDDALYPKVKLNILFANDVKYKAGRHGLVQHADRRPARRPRAGPGTQTVSGTCSAPVGSQVLHDEHAHAQARDGRHGGLHPARGATSEIVHTGADDSYPAEQEAGHRHRLGAPRRLALDAARLPDREARRLVQVQLQLRQHRYDRR